MLRKIFYTVILLFIFSEIIQAQVSFNLPANATPSNINYSEYYIDTDPGFGSGTSIPLTSSTDVSANNVSVNINAVASGVHRIYFRTRDTKGTWSLTNVQTFFKLYPDAAIPANPAAANIVKIEYFIDTDPGFGKGTSIPVTSSDDINANNVLLDVSSFATGVHHIYFRSLDGNGNWSLTNVQTFFIANVVAQIPSNPTAANIVKMEYFIDTDPGFGKGNPISITSSMDVSAADVAIDLSGLSDGVHDIYFRSQDANGSWSETNVQTFNILLANVIIPSNPVAGNITQLEYFFDIDPGFGNGTTITIPSTTDLSNYTFAANLTGLKNDTTHTLYIRTYDNWSLTNTRTFVIGSALPVTWISFNGNWKNSSHYSVLLNWQTANEENNMKYDVQRSEDGIHFETVGNVAGSGTSTISHNYSFTDDLQNASQNVASPVLYYRIRQTDVDGHFTYSVIISLKDPSAIKVQISPNPSKGLFKLFLDKKPDKPVLLSIYDNKGSLIEEKKITNVQTSLNLSEKTKGMYWLHLQYADGSNKTLSMEMQ